MRFLRRGGKVELPVEAESLATEPVDEAPTTSSRPAWLDADHADAAGAPAAEADVADPPAVETAETDAGEAVESARGDAEPKAADSEVAKSGDAPAPEAELAPPEPEAEAEREPGPADSDSEPEHVVAEVEAEPVAAAPAPKSRRRRAASVEPASASAAESEPDAAVLVPSDAQDLAGLVGGGRSAVEPEAEPAPTPAHPFAPNLVIDDSVWPDPLAEGRPAALRLAGLHLRTGQHALARAELESLAGRGRLDEPALLDLAEVRWRTGDLSGAGDAANALLARGTDAPLALVIAAEAVAAAGRPSEARRLSARALEAMVGPLEPVFAGMPRAMIWPVAATPEPSPETPRRRSRKTKREVDGAPSTAAEAFAGGRAALAKGDTGRAALLLGVAMRLEPGFAEDVLRAVAGRDDQPLLALVRGDALRLLGREAEAREAFDRARGRSSASATASPEPAGPGLFDDDPG